MWILDIRGTDHMTPYKGHLSNYKSHKSLSVKCRGWVTPTSNVFLSYGGDSNFQLFICTISQNTSDFY